jgi:hypothetical protein
MLSVLRIVGIAAGAYLAFGLVLYLARHRLIFPAPRDTTPEPARFGMPDGRRVTVPLDDGTRVVGWYLPPRDPSTARAPALLWFHGNGETVAGIAPVLREFRPTSGALLALDYRGYGESEGRPTVRHVERDAVTAYRWLAARPEVDPARIVVYGRSVGSGPATFVAASEPVAGLILESAFTSLAAMARLAAPFLPIGLARLGFDNAANLARVRAPILLIHGEADGLVPFPMHAELAAVVGGRAEVWTIPRSDHNGTYDVGGEEYVRRVRAFFERVATGEVGR